jgi:hypothetical protein
VDFTKFPWETGLDVEKFYMQKIYLSSYKSKFLAEQIVINIGTMLAYLPSAETPK